MLNFNLRSIKEEHLTQHQLKLFKLFFILEVLDLDGNEFF
jgi:hypothetical protein